MLQAGNNHLPLFCLSRMLKFWRIDALAKLFLSYAMLQDPPSRRSILPSKEIGADPSNRIYHTVRVCTFVRQKAQMRNCPENYFRHLYERARLMMERGKMFLSCFRLLLLCACWLRLSFYAIQVVQPSSALQKWSIFSCPLTTENRLSTYGRMKRIAPWGNC